MVEPSSLIPVRSNDLAVGQPLRKPVYDRYGNLLLASGSVIESRSQLEDLIDSGFIHDPRWDIGPAKSTSSLLVSKAKINDTPPSEANPADKEVMIGMDDVRWHVGETLYLQVLDNPVNRYTVRLIGYIKSKTVFVTPPMFDGKLEFIRDGQVFVVRAFSGRRAYAFTTVAVKSIHTPHPYLQLAYPKQIRCTVIRCGARAQVKIGASVSSGTAEQGCAATINDLSTGGASYILKSAPGQKGESGRIRFTVRAADREECLDLKIVLRSVSPVESGEGFKCGVEFVETSDRERLILSAFVHQTLAEGD